MPFKTMNFKGIDHARALQLVEDRSWMMSVKYDGYGVFAGCTDGKPFVYAAKSGETLKKGINPNILRNLQEIWAATGGVNFKFRGELDFNGTSVDQGVVRVWETVDFPNETALTRYNSMWAKIDAWARSRGTEMHAPVMGTNLDPQRDKLIYVVPTEQYLTVEQKRTILGLAIRGGEEGVVFSRIDGLYVPDKRVDHVLKYKFVETADLRIVKWVADTVDVNGYAHGVADVAALENGSWQSVGQVHIRSNIIAELKQWDASHPGQPYPPLEAAYLYYTGGCLMQPIAKQLRYDKLASKDEFAFTGLDQLRRSNRWGHEPKLEGAE